MDNMEFKGTSGKWFTIDNKIGAIYSEDTLKLVKQKGLAESCAEICQCWEDFEDNKIISTEQMKANALLISKAPEMLELLKTIVNDFESDYVLNGEIVDNPSNFLKFIYKESKELIKQATTL